MLDFLEFIFLKGLLDIPLVGGNFTWSNNRDSRSCSKIDRFLSLQIGKNNFLMSLRGDPRILSDHIPLMLDCSVRPVVVGILSLRICG
jgi:hypothetical protein